MNLNDTMDIVRILPSHRSIMLEGPTGVGKSSLTRAIAKEFNLKYLDIRLGQMQEGDLALPHVSKDEVGDGHTTSFAIAKWFKEASKEPCLVCFEELNRAPSVGVLQQVFQIFLDRELHGVKLHPETRIMSCINVGQEYQVLELDPALLQRFYRIQYLPTTQEWLSFASREDVMHSLLHEFLSKQQDMIDFQISQDPMEVVPSRRGWFDIGQDSKELIGNIMTEKGKEDADQSVLAGYTKVLKNLISSRVGETAAIAFTQYLDNKKTYSPEFVFTGNQDEIFNDLSYLDLNIYADQVARLVTDYAVNEKPLPKGVSRKKAISRWASFYDRLSDETVMSIWKAYYVDICRAGQKSKDWADATLSTLERASDIMWVGKDDND